MDIKEIRQLIKLMIDNDLSEVDIASGQDKVAIKRGTGGVPVVTAAPAVPVAAAPAQAAPAEKEEKAEKPADNLIEIKSPMVGTYYSAASPETDDFVSVGTSVANDTLVCIVEAMKVMNEIKAECSGTIAEICVKNSQPLEFGQVLFRVKPA